MRRHRQSSTNRAVLASPPRLAKQSAEINKAIGDVATAVNASADSVPYLDVDLVVGVNRISHGLGRPMVGLIVVPRTASAAFAYGFDPAQAKNPNPERHAWIDVIGVATTARLFCF